MARGRKAAKRAVPEPDCAFCRLDFESGATDVLSCFECGSSAHAACLHITDPSLLAKCQSISWYCADHKRCSCVRDASLAI